MNHERTPARREGVRYGHGKPSGGEQVAAPSLRCRMKVPHQWLRLGGPGNTARCLRMGCGQEVAGGHSYAHFSTPKAPGKQDGDKRSIEGGRTKRDSQIGPCADSQDGVPQTDARKARQVGTRAQSGMNLWASRSHLLRGNGSSVHLAVSLEKRKFEIPHCKGEQCLPLRGKHDYL